MRRLRSEQGFGLIELLIAMVMLNVGILAVVAALDSGAFALKRANTLSNATALADKQMEMYHALRNCAIYVRSTTIPGAGTTYRSDPAWPTSGIEVTESQSATTDVPLPASCTTLNPANATYTNAHQDPVTGADGHSYVIDTYVTIVTPPSGEKVKLVSVVVRDEDKPTRYLVREASTFDYYAAP